MPLLTTLFSSFCRTKNRTLDSRFLVTFLCLTLSSSLEASTCIEEAPNVNNLLDISKCLVNISNTALQQFKQVFNCVLSHGFAEDPGNEPIIRKACMNENCYSGKKYDHQINHDPQKFTSCKDTIYAVLKSYLTDIQNLNFPDLLSAVNYIMRALNDGHIQVQPLSSTQPPQYKVHREQCRTLLILQQLSQTIHRSLSYLKSQEMITQRR